MSTSHPAFTPGAPEGGASTPAPDSPLPDRSNQNAAVPADVNTPLGWRDLLLLVVFYVVGGGILYFVVASVASGAFHIPLSRLQDHATGQASVLIVAQALLSFGTLAFLYLIVRARGSGDFWLAVGWRPLHNVASRGAAIVQYVLTGIGLALAAGIVGRYLDNGSTLPIEELFHNRQTVLLLMALGILVAPMVEETIFRGCIYPVVARKFGLPAGVILTGTLFGLAHAEQLWGGWGQIATLISVGIILTYIRARAGTVVASYFVHLGYNTILFVGFYFATGGLRYFPGT